MKKLLGILVLSLLLIPSSSYVGKKVKVSKDIASDWPHGIITNGLNHKKEHGMKIVKKKDGHLSA